MKPYETNGHTYCTLPDGSRQCTGAMLGRYGDLDRATAAKLRLQRVRIDSGGYDPGGAYWGIGAPLYWVSDDECGSTAYVRAATRDKAKQSFPNARWYR